MEMIKMGERDQDLVIDFCGRRSMVVDLGGYKNYLARIHEKTGFKGDPAESYFAYLINVILINNLAEMILEQARLMTCKRIGFSEPGQISALAEIELTGHLDAGRIIGHVSNLLRHSEEFMAGDLAVDRLDAETPKYTSDGQESSGVQEILNYQPQGVTDFKERLNSDLIAFQFVKKNHKNEQGRFILPVYVDEVSLAEQGNVDIEKYLPAWASMHYLQMLTKIHDFFIQTYQWAGPKGFQNDDLMVALVDLLDYQISPYPEGLQKSLEVGRSTSGKCSFIVGPLEAFAIPQEIMIGLQTKDIFGFVPRIRELPLRGE